MTLIRLPSRAIYRTDTIIDLLANSPLKNLGEVESYRYLFHVHGIEPSQIKGNFQAVRIKAHNKRVSLAWKYQGSNCKPFTPSTVPAVTADLSRVLVAAEHGVLPSLYRDAS